MLFFGPETIPDDNWTISRLYKYYIYIYIDYIWIVYRLYIDNVYTIYRLYMNYI